MSPEIAISICKWDKESTWYELIREWNRTFDRAKFLEHVVCNDYDVYDAKHLDKLYPYTFFNISII